MSEAEAIIAALDLSPHPEGGWYRETWREPSPGSARGHASAIHFLLEAGQRSHWHRVDASEMWIFNAGAPLRLMLADGEDGDIALADVILGSDIISGEVAQHRIAAGQWQAAQPLGAYALVTCIVAPGFDFAGFALAPVDWTPAALR